MEVFNVLKTGEPTRLNSGGYRTGPTSDDVLANCAKQWKSKKSLTTITWKLTPYVLDNAMYRRYTQSPNRVSLM